MKNRPGAHAGAGDSVAATATRTVANGVVTSSLVTLTTEASRTVVPDDVAYHRFSLAANPFPKSRPLSLPLRGWSVHSKKQ